MKSRNPRARRASRSRGIGVHGEFLNVRGTKMSKRHGNFLTARDLREQGVDGRRGAAALFQTHYRQPAHALHRRPRALRPWKSTGLAIVRLKKEQPHRGGIDTLFAQIARGEKVSMALRHLRAAHIEKLAVHPMPRERLARRASDCAISFS